MGGQMYWTKAQDIHDAACALRNIEKIMRSDVVVLLQQLVNVAQVFVERTTGAPISTEELNVGNMEKRQ